MKENLFMMVECSRVLLE